MNQVNYYPVAFKDFDRIKSVGNYVVNYAILDDRIHVELPIENSVFVSQSFYDSIKKDMPNSSTEEIVKFFIRKFLLNQTSYRYYPTKETIIELKKIKLYSKLIVRKYEVDEELDSKEDNIIENDQEIRLYNKKKLIMIAEKML